jgi:hypothetical protein
MRAITLSKSFNYGLKYGLIVSIVGLQMVRAQSYGTIHLPTTLCDSGVQVQRAATSTPTLTQWGEGPAVAQNGNLFFAEQNAGNVWKVTPGREYDQTGQYRHLQQWP